MKLFAKVRIFFVCAIIVSATFDLVTNNSFSQPFEQLTLSAVAGIIGVGLAKIAHVV